MTRELVLVVRDDFDGTPKATTVSFGYQGRSFEIDLSEQRMTEFDRALAPYLARAREVDPNDDTEKKKPARTRRSPRDLSKIRSWWQDKTGDALPNGRVPKRVHQQYNDDHPGEEIPL